MPIFLRILLTRSEVPLTYGAEIYLKLFFGLIRSELQNHLLPANQSALPANLLQLLYEEKLLYKKKYIK